MKRMTLFVLYGLTASLVFVPFLAWAQTSPTVEPYLEVNGSEALPAGVQISRSASQIKVIFRAPRDGTYSFGLSIRTEELAPLSPGLKRYNCAALTQPFIVHYPYDWTSRDRGSNIMSARPRLVMPGLSAGGQIYLADTHELFSLRLEPCTNGRLRAVLLAHRFFNDGGDRATPKLHLRAGETREFTARIYKDIQTANRERFGEHPPMKGNMTAIAFLEYAEDTARENDAFFGASGNIVCCRSLTPQEWEVTARKLQGAYRYAIVRDQVSKSIAPPFHQRGMLVYHYEYLGAWRRHSKDVTPEIERDFALRDVKGELYMAPRSPDGVFLLVDIRRPEVRAKLVKDARDAVHAGFDGVFLDGWPFWSDSTGDVGGNVPSATESLAYARWPLLEETRAAIRAENPAATMGILTNLYYDSFGIGDWMMKEFMYGSWFSVEPISGNKSVGEYRPASGSQINQDKDKVYEENEAPFVAGPVAFGAKGFSPIAVQSMRHFLRHPSGLYYAEAGTFPIPALEKYMHTIAALMKQDDLYVTSIDPSSCWVKFEGQATMHSDNRCVVKISRRACLTPLPGGKPESGDTFTLDPGVRYELSRECKN